MKSNAKEGSIIIRTFEDRDVDELHGRLQQLNENDAFQQRARQGISRAYELKV